MQPGPLDYATPDRRPAMSDERREVLRRFVQRAAALTIVFLLGGVVAGNAVARARRRDPADALPPASLDGM
jgi:hypothetical protein